MGKFERGSFPESIRWKKILAQRPAAADINDPGGFKLVDAKSFWTHCNLQEVEEQIRHDFSQFEGPRDLLDSILGIDQTACLKSISLLMNKNSWSVKKQQIRNAPAGWLMNCPV